MPKPPHKSGCKSGKCGTRRVARKILPLKGSRTSVIDGNKFFFPQWYMSEHGAKAKTSFWLAPINSPAAYEKQERNLIKTHFDGSERVLEIGCYVGVVSCLINKIIKDNRAHVAIELINKYAKLLRANRAINGCKFEVIVGQVVKPSKRIHRDWYKLEKTIDLNEIADKYNFNTLIMDCEGAEFDVIDQYPDIVASMDKLMIEWHRVLNGDRDEIRNRYMTRLRDMGFKVLATKSNVDFLTK